jgi:nitroreductase
MKKDDLSPEVKAHRTADYPISSFLLNRWSPRAMTDEPISQEQLFSLFEAARWAPSSYNNQPWIFIYGIKGTPAWKALHELQVPFNQGWTQNSGALVLVVSKDNFYHNDKPARTHSFDTGAAWMSLALEGNGQGLVVHGMQGFDYEAAKKKLHIPQDYTVEAMVAIGKPAPKETLPAELQEREAPSTRRPITDFIMEGVFKEKSSNP